MNISPLLASKITIAAVKPLGSSKIWTVSGLKLIESVSLKLSELCSISFEWNEKSVKIKKQQGMLPVYLSLHHSILDISDFLIHPKKSSSVSLWKSSCVVGQRQEIY